MSMPAYKAIKNLICNEFGINKETAKGMVKEVVREETVKAINQLIDSLREEIRRDIISNLKNGSYYKQAVIDAIGQELRKNYEIQVKPKDEQGS